MKNVIFLDAWGKTYPIMFYTDTYADTGNLYVGMVTEDEDGFIKPWRDLTKKLCAVCSPNCGFIDVANNSENIVEWLENNNLGKTTGRNRASGYCYYPEFEFYIEELSKYLY